MALFMVLAVVAYVFYFAAVQGEPDNASHFSLVRRFVVFITLYIATLAVIFLIAHLFLSDSIENRLAVAVFANLAILFYTWAHNRFFWKKLVGPKGGLLTWFRSREPGVEPQVQTIG